MRALVGLIGALLLVGLLPAPAPARTVATHPDVQTPEPVRIMLVGDSVTQGSAGDWTWRYRLWRHFADAGVAVDFVGPRDDLLDNVTGTQGSTAYAEPAFDRDHAARWGMQVEVLDVPIEQLVADYQPDVVVEMLGVNDLVFGYRAPAAVAARVGAFVDGARSVDPTVDVVVAEATQHWFTNVPEFNDAVAGLVEMSTAESQVALARTAHGYDKLADTWDTSHPNARGEVRIASAVADALHELGVGPPASRPRVMPPVGPRSPAVVEARALDSAVELSWTGPPGATAQYIWGRDATAGEPWQKIPWPVTGTSWTAYLLTNGHRYQYRLQPIKGDDEPEGRVRSEVVTAVPFRPPTAPIGLRSDAGKRCATLRWREPEFATRYEVARRTRTGWRPAGWAPRARYAAERLPVARSWRFRVTAWHRATPGGSAYLTVRRGPSGAPCR